MQLWSQTCFALWSTFFLKYKHLYCLFHYFFYSCSDSPSNRTMCPFHPLHSFLAASRLSVVMRVGPKASASVRDASGPPRPISEALGCTILSRAVRFCTIILPAFSLMIMPPLEISQCLFGVPLSRMSPQRHLHVILSATSINYSQVSIWWAVGKRQFLDCGKLWLF